MRIAVVLLLLTCVACRSAPRDYNSINRTSWNFLKESARKGHKLSKQELKRNLTFSDRAPFNLDQARQSRSFFYKSIWKDETDNFVQMLGRARGELRGWEYRRGQVRFGFLDSGD